MPTFSKLEEFSQALTKKQGELDYLQKHYDSLELRLKQTLKEQTRVVESRSIIQRAVFMTQERLKYKISSVVTQALATIFDDPYEFKVEFVERRNATECDLLFSRGGEDYDPLESAGHGAADVASFTLRISYWLLSATAPLIILDEPFRHLSEDLQPAAAYIIKTLAKEFDLQFIIVSHEEEITNCADRHYKFYLDNRITNFIWITG